MTYQDAVAYINFSIKEGYAYYEQFIGMSKKELIEWAEYNADKGDYYANLA